MIDKILKILPAGVMAFIMTFPVEAAEIDTKMYETLRTPNYEEFQLDIEDAGISYTMDACDGRVYIIGEGLTIEHEKKEAPVVLIYDENSNNWSSIWATFIDSDGELDIIAGDDVLYFFDNHYSSLAIYGYDLNSKEVKELAEFNWDIEKRAPELSYDGEYIWMYGGEYRDADTGMWMMLSDVSRWDVSSGKLEEVDISEEEKETLFFEITEKKEEQERMLADAEAVLDVCSEDEMSGALSKDYFYVFGETEVEGQREQCFYRFSVVKESVVEEEIIEETPAEDSSEEMNVSEETNDSEDDIMVLIAAICVFVFVGSVIGHVKGKKVKKKESQKGEDE